jgi:photosystem II stability/assembly factor-like uncharacterized protein
MKTAATCGALAALLAFAGAGVAGQPAPASPPGQFDRLPFRGIGPASMSGRIGDVAVDEKDPARFYVAAATGGLWKTTNNGTTWEVLFSDQPDVVSIGDIAIGPSDANLVWVGTGENNNRQSSSWGNGVYKSTDGGRSWAHTGLLETRHIGRIVIDPANPDIVYVAATGAMWGPSKERGVYKTADGGRTWSLVLFVDEDTGATDLVMDPTNSHVLYAATYQRRRAAWGFSGDGPGSAVYKSTDAGRTWTKLTNGLPGGRVGRIGLDVYRRDPRVVYARVEHPTDGGIFRSDDAGRSWKRMSDENPRPMYFGQIRIDPTNDHRLYVLGVNLHMSDDGGRTFVTDRSAVQTGIWPEGSPINASMHTDHHAMWINPANPRHIILGTDGGVGISYDRGGTWDMIDNMDLGQFYRVGFDMAIPYGLYGGLQDNLSWGGVSAVRSYLGIANADWFLIGGGDGFASFADPNDPDTIYTEAQQGSIVRVNRRTNERKTIKPEAPAGSDPLRWNWNTPMMLSPHDSNTLLAGANRLLRSADRGQSWEAISPDLTAQQDREEFSLMGVRARDFTSAKNDGVAQWPTLTTIAESPRQRGVYYTGADDGTVHASRDAGKSWTNISDRFPGLPRGTYVGELSPSAADAGTVYASFDGHRSNDYGVYVYGSRDFGQTWTRLSSGMPAGHVVRTIKEDLRNPDVLYVGTEFGLFVSLDRGAGWARLKSNLPTVPIYDIAQHPRDNDLILGTHGRSIWILDDLTPIQQAGKVPGNRHALFDLRPARQFNRAHDRWWMAGDRKFYGTNPPFGAIMNYRLAGNAKDVRFTVRDGSGAVIRTLHGGIPTSPGIHRVVWDLRYDPVQAGGAESQGPEPPQIGPDQQRSHSFQNVPRAEVDPLLAPFVIPGDYRVTLTVDGTDAGVKAVTVLPDWLVEITDADRKTLLDTTLGLHELQKTAADGARAVSEVTQQVKLLSGVLGQADGSAERVAGAIRQLDERLTSLRRQFGVTGQGEVQRGGRGLPGRIGGLKSQIMASTSLPTELQLRSRSELQQELDKAVAAVNAVINSDLPGVYGLLRGSELRPAAVRPVGAGRSSR